MTTLPTTPAAADLVSQTEFVRTQVATQVPGISLGTGSGVDSLLVTPSAYLAALHLTRANSGLAASSLSALTDAVTAGTAVDADVDAVASNYFLTRASATAATGWIAIVMSVSQTVSIPAGFTFLSGTNQYQVGTATRAYPVGTPGVTESDTIRLVRARTDGKYEFTVKVTSVTSGAGYRLGKGTVVTFSSYSFGFTSAYVSADFTDGTDAETNASLVARAAASMTRPVLGSQESSTAFLAVSIPGVILQQIGMGDPLMQRDRRNIMGISTGGRTDLWIRNGAGVSNTTYQVTGTVTNASAKTVQLTLTAPQSYGLYRVTAIRPTGSSVTGVTPTSVVRTIVPESTFTPDMPGTIDSAFTAHVSNLVTFTDSLSTGTLTLNQQIVYDVDVAYNAVVRTAAALVIDPANRVGSDYLARGSVPVRTSVAIGIRTPAGLTAPDSGTIQALASQAIQSSVPSTIPLTGYTVTKALASALGGSEVSSIQFSGTVWAPDGTNVTILPATSILVPTDLTKLYSPSNAFFACSPTDVTVLAT